MTAWWVTVERYEMHDVAGLGECAVGQELGRLAPGDWRVTVNSDGKVDVVPMRLSAAAREAWGAEMWVDAPEQGDERPRMMAGLWPKPEGEATHCLADDPDPTEQENDR